MKLFSWLRPAPCPTLNVEQQQRLTQLPGATPLSDCSLREQRWVVVDLETSGLNLNKDQVLSIGAVVIEDGAIDFSQQFERTLHRPAQKTNPSVLIHGLGPDALAAGSAPATALLELLEFIGDSPVLATPGAAVQALERVLAVRAPGMQVIPFMSAGATDSLHFRRAGIPTVGMGPLLASEDNDFLIRMGVSRKLLTDIMYKQQAVKRDGNPSTRYCLSQAEVREYNVMPVEKPAP